MLNENDKIRNTFILILKKEDIKILLMGGTGDFLCQLYLLVIG